MKVGGAGWPSQGWSFQHEDGSDQWIQFESTAPTAGSPEPNKFANASFETLQSLIPTPPAPPRERTSEEWARIAAAWDHRTDSYELYLAMTEHGWDVGDGSKSLALRGQRTRWPARRHGDEPAPLRQAPWA